MIESYSGVDFKMNSLQARAVHRLRTLRRWLQSATPWTSEPSQLFSAFHLIHTDPETGAVTNPLFASRREFRQLLTGSREARDQLYTLKAAVSIRWTKDELVDEEGYPMYSRKKEALEYVEEENSEGDESSNGRVRVKFTEGTYLVTREQTELALRIIRNLGQYLLHYLQNNPNSEYTLSSISSRLKLLFLNWGFTSPKFLGEDIPTNYWDKMDEIVLERVRSGRQGIIQNQNRDFVNEIVRRYRDDYGIAVAQIDGQVLGYYLDGQGHKVYMGYDSEGNLVEGGQNVHAVSIKEYEQQRFQRGEARIIVVNSRILGIDLSAADWELYAQRPENFVPETHCVAEMLYHIYDGN